MTPSVAARLAAGVACLLCLCLSSPAGATSAPRHAAVLVVTTTSTLPATTTTAAPSTTTTVPPTTTTTTSSTTTTTLPVTTTTSTHPSTTTTTSPPTAVPASGTPWGLIALIVVLILAIVGVILLWTSRNKRAALDAWRRRARPALSDARLAREGLLSPSAVADDPELRGAVAAQVERASTALEHAATTAPDPAAGGSAATAAAALRGLAFAIEADRLLRHGAGTPSGVQLAQADQARRDRDAELGAALGRLQGHVTPSNVKA